jgi:hypothetical protein
MNERAISIARLREKAARCRHFALQAQSDGIAAEFESLARDYETDADWLEATRADRFATRIH